MTGLDWSARSAACEVSGALISAASLINHEPGLGDTIRDAIVAGLDDAGRALVRELAARLNRAEFEQMIAGMSTGELHRRRLHPDWEYATTEGPRKQWDYSDVPPGGEGWVRNRCAGRDGWERFEYTEESYWMRPVR